jgi:hypothetical protein
MFINVSNHPSSRWSDDQREAALALGGEIRDVQFPNVPALATSDDVLDMAFDLADEIAAISQDVVAMVQGEFSLTIAVVNRLRAHGVKCVVACSEREVVETVANGETTKTAVFRFRQFREV